MSLIERRLAELSIKLPRAPRPHPHPQHGRPVGNYVAGVVAGEILYLSGATGTVPSPDDSDVQEIQGKLGAELSIEDGYASARTMAINHIAMMKAVLGDLDRVVRILKMVGYVNAAPGFIQAPLVLNGASDLLVAAFGPEIGSHARAALYQPDLSMNAPVEAELTVQVRR
ncbi:RidA family protein [Bradyrhizobium sp. LA7.1]|uniref:RidA family protein n=1 Tax=Bradyrhizobium sp. LA7.1 TaxID=3156324 RepID=UPI0033936D37